MGRRFVIECPSHSFAAVLIGAGLLTWPLLLNTYPILFSDTGGLLEMGFLPSMGWDKPFVYGPLAAAISLHLTLFLPAITQATVLSYILWATQAAFASPRSARHLAICLGLTTTTAAPWFASTLLPDALTPVAVLGLLSSLGQRPTHHRRPVAIITAVAIASHLSHLIIAAAMIAALVAVQRRLPWRAISSLAAALIFLIASNWIGYGRLAVSPYGSVFALARLIADGPARDYLAQTCPASGFALCAWRDKLTDDSDQFLWNPNSPFWTDPLPLPEFAAQASRIVAGAVRAEPIRVLASAARNATRQLGRADLGDTLAADFLDDAVRPRIARWYPAAELKRYDASRQVSGTLAPSAAALLPLQRMTLLIGLIACAASLISGLRRRSPRADAAAIILIALAANAFATGALSAVHDRYEARLAWIVLLPALLQFVPPASNQLRAASSAGDIRTRAS